MWGEILTASEVEYCRTLFTELRSAQWINPLLRRLQSQKWTYATKPLLFELRVAAEIHRAGLTASYEYAAGVGTSRVDFRFQHEGCEWLVEVVSVLKSDAVKSATWDNGFAFGTTLSSDSEDGRQSVGGELIVAQQKIAQKVWDGETWVKFPPPTEGRYHVILADMRGMAITGGDIADYAQLAYGPRVFDAQTVPFAARFEGKVIRGLFELTDHPLKAASAVRERIHFLGFCNDESYEPSSIPRASRYLPNPQLIASHHIAKSILGHLPLSA